MRSYLLPLILIVCGAGLSAMAELSVPAERQDAVAQIDFDALHAQANTALEALRQPRGQRQAPASVAVF